VTYSSKRDRLTGTGKSATAGPPLCRLGGPGEGRGKGGFSTCLVGRRGWEGGNALLFLDARVDSEEKKEEGASCPPGQAQGNEGERGGNSTSAHLLPAISRHREGGGKKDTKQQQLILLEIYI